MRLTALLSMAARVVVPKDYRYGTNRPWTAAAKRLNPPGKKRRKVFVEPIAHEDWWVFRGDSVSTASADTVRLCCKQPKMCIMAHIWCASITCFCFVFIYSQVEILAGKDKGKQGKVVQVFRHRNWVILAGLNTVRKSS